MFSSGPPKPTSKPLSGPPPVELPCKPTLLLGIPDYVLTELSYVLINDLIFSSTSRYASPLDASTKLEILQFLDWPSLLNMTREYGGTVIHPEDDVLDQTTGEVDTKRLNQLSKQKYQAIVVDDTCFIREPAIAQFVLSQYEKGVSVVVMGMEGIYDLGSLRSSFGVDWNLSAYTTRTIQLTETGKRIIGLRSFPHDTMYVKAHFVVGEHQLFREYINPADYEDDSDYEDGPPAPSPGSPVVTVLRNNKSVSYFGFANTLDVSYGAIILRLCYAAQHNDPDSGEQIGASHNDPDSSEPQIGARDANDDGYQPTYMEWYSALVVRMFDNLFGASKDKAD